MVTVIAKVRNPSKNEEALNLAAQEQDYKNAKFAKASPARQRVIIARDVLKWLRVGKITAMPGTYLSKAGKNEDGRYEPDRLDGAKCQACALGAVFACTVERTGGLNNFWRQGAWGQQGTYETLKPYFSEEQLGLIECAFEQSDGFIDNPSPEQFTLALKASTFGARNGAGLRHDQARERMVAIMKNIIANKGTFVP